MRKRSFIFLILIIICICWGFYVEAYTLIWSQVSNPSYYYDDEARGVAVDSTGVYIVGYWWNDSPSSAEWHIEKRNLSTGSLTWSQNSHPAGSTYNYANGVAVDGTGVYIVGYDEAPGNSEWRIEKRSLTNGSLTWSQVSNPSTGTDSANGVAVDGTGVYIVGYDEAPGNSEWRIEKRSLTNGSLTWSQVSNPTNTDCDKANGVAVDSTGVYIVGSTADSSGYCCQWRIEKRSLSNGTLTWYQHVGGTSYRANGVAVDSTGVYVVGEDNLGWRIEKRSLTNGSLTWSQISTGNYDAYGVAIDSTGVYVVGTDKSASQDYQWRIEKRGLTDGSLIWSTVSNPKSGQYGYDEAFGVAVDSAGIYIVGYDSASASGMGEEWRIEKRSKEAPITPPTVTTDIATVGATEIQNDRAILKGTVTNNGGATITNIRFMWGTTSGSYPNSSGDISCSGCSTFQWTKTGMTAGTTYYYKAQASNSAGWSDLNDPNNSEKRVVIFQAPGGQQSFKTHQCESDADCPSDININACQYTDNYCDTAATYECKSSTVTCGANQATKGATSCSAVTTTNYCDYACDGLCRIGYRGCASSGSTCETTFRAWQNCSANTTCSGNSCLATNYCATNQCRDGGGWHHKCSKWCDGSNNCTNWADATCVDHCTNGVKDCDETGIDTGGSCPVVTCVIGGTTYNNGDYNPTNKCQICDVSKSTTAWSNVTDGTDPAGWCNPSWNSCDSACVRKGGDGDCYSGTCDTNHLVENIPAGYVCTGAGNATELSCTNYCGTAGNYCTEDRQKGEFRQACGGTGSCNGALIGCNNLQDCGATSSTCFSKCQKDYIFTCSNGICGTYHTYTTASQDYYCSGGSLINTGSCATSAYNARSADKCDKKRDLYRCNGTGYTDSDCNYDVGDDWAYVSTYKIANTSGQEVDASSGDNTGTCHSCTEGSCSGTLKWSECDGSGSAGPCATYNQPETIYAQEGYTLTATCGTNGTAYCLTNQCRDDGGWHHKCSQRCDASHNCTYWVDATCQDHCTNGIKDCDETAVDEGGSCPIICDCVSNVLGGCCDSCYFCPEGTVNNGAGTCVTPGSIYHCNSWEDCDDGDCSATQRWYGCTGTAETCSATSYQTETITASNGYVLKADCSQAVLGCANYCGTAGYICTGDRYRYQNRQACGGTGSCNGSVVSCYIQDCGVTSNTCWSNCRKDYTYTCSAGACGTYHTYTTASQGYYCSGGSLINSGSCAVSAYNARSADKCDKKRDLYRCNGTGYTDSDCNYDVGDDWAYVSTYKIANTSGQEVDASSGDNTGTCHSCTEGSCSGTLKWSECDGSGSAGPCATYNQPETIYPVAGYSLTSTCGTTGTTLCDATLRASSGPGDNNYGAGGDYNCQGSCDGSGNCDYAVNCEPIDTTSPTTTIKIIRTSTGEDITTAGAWLRADTYTIQFEDKDQADGSGLNCENCSCEYSVYSCDVGGTNCNTVVVSLTSRTPNFSFDIVAGRTAPTYNLEGVGRYLIYSGVKDMANQSATPEYRYINFDFTPPETRIE